MSFGVAIHVVNSVLESWRSDIVIKSSDGLFLIVGEFPDDQCNANAVGEDGVKVGELIEAAIVHSGHGNFAEALELGHSDIFQKPGGKFRTKDAQIFAIFDSERAKAFFAAESDVESFV